MTINNWDEYKKNLWDWGFLDNCFSGKIKVTDIDGFVERKGKFLLLETKSPNSSIPDGQQITFDALRKTSLFTIFVIWGIPDNPERIQIMNKSHIYPPQPCNKSKLIDLCKRWFAYADNSSSV